MEVVAPENSSRKSRSENTAAIGFFLGGVSFMMRIPFGRYDNLYGQNQPVKWLTMHY
jgi:hypothetical protein